MDASKIEGKLPFTCGRIDDPHRREVTGSVEKACESCGHTIVVGPDTVALALSCPIPHCFICVQCFRQYADDRGNGFITYEIVKSG